MIKTTFLNCIYHIDNQQINPLVETGGNWWIPAEAYPVDSSGFHHFLPLSASVSTTFSNYFRHFLPLSTSVSTTLLQFFHHFPLVFLPLSATFYYFPPLSTTFHHYFHHFSPLSTSVSTTFTTDSTTFCLFCHFPLVFPLLSTIFCHFRFLPVFLLLSTTFH
jgi:hypothetical protein